MTTPRPTARFVFAVAVAVAGWLIAAVPVASAQSNDDDRKARELYLVGDNHYAAGRYEEALKYFEKAYSLSKRPQLLYNIANAYERIGEYDKAADYLRRYIDSPEAEDVSSVRERIKRLEMNSAARRRDRERTSETEAGRTTEPLPLAPTGGQLAPEDTERKQKSRRPAYLFIAGGGAAVGSSVVFALAARSAAADAEDLCVPNGLCPDSAEDALRRERTFAIVADVTAGLGVAAVCVGVYLLLRDRGSPEKDERSVRIGPEVYGRGAGVGFSGDF